MKSQRQPKTKWPGTRKHTQCITQNWFLPPAATPVPHSSSSCSVVVLWTSAHFLGSCMGFWICFLQKKWKGIQYYASISQQQTAGPGGAAVFPSKLSPFYQSPFTALILLQCSGNAVLICILERLFVCFLFLPYLKLLLHLQECS